MLVSSERRGEISVRDEMGPQSLHTHRQSMAISSKADLDRRSKASVSKMGWARVKKVDGIDVS